MSGTTVGRSAFFKGRTDDDLIKINSTSIDRGLGVRTGRGDDAVVVTGTSPVGRRLLASGGPGTDSLQIEDQVSQPKHTRTRSFESSSVDATLLTTRIDDPESGLTAAVQLAQSQFVRAAFAVDLSGDSPIQSNGALIVTDPNLNIALSGTPGSTVQLDTGGDGAFDDGSVTLDSRGQGAIQTMLVHDATNNGLNHLALRGVENGAPLSSAPQELNIQYAVGTVTRFETSLGSFDVELLNSDAPDTVQNFLNYGSRYAGSIIHRWARTNTGEDFIVQGGGYDIVPPLTPIQTDAPVRNEFNAANSNVRGTLSMALPANNPDGGTSQWFVNVADNSFLDANKHTVFGRVIGDGMSVVDAIHALPAFNISGALNDPALTTAPLQNYMPFTVALTGKVATMNGSATVTGTGTRFDQELIAGAAVRINGTSFTIASIESAIQLALDRPALTTASNATAFTNAAPADDQYVKVSSIGMIANGA